MCPSVPACPFVCWLFPSYFLTVVLLTGLLPRTLHQWRAPALGSPLLSPHGGCCGIGVSVGLGRGRTSEQVEPHFV